MAADYGRGLYKEYELLLTEHEAVKAECKLLQKEHCLLQKERKLKEALQFVLDERTKEVEALKKEILRLNGRLNADGTNSGIPTSKTSLSKNKVIPNSREKTGKKIGGQPGHPKSKLKAFTDQEVTETEHHDPEACPFCGGPAMETGESICKDELDYEVVAKKKRHQFPVCECGTCGRSFHPPIPVKLKEENQYGSRVRALGLSLMNIGNVSVNKARKMIYGLSEEEINPTEGYLIKQQRKAAEDLAVFMRALQKRCLSLPIVYWDDTVIDINARRGCLRFYGDEQLALYTAH